MTTSVQVANLFQLRGRHLHITYAATGFDGKARFTYQDANQSLGFEGNEIRVVESEIGDLVSVTIRHTIDSGSTSFTLLVPHVNIAGSGNVAVSTQGITTIHRSSLLPALDHGQRELYEVEHLTGTASFVIP